MEPHSTAETPQKESPNRLLPVVSGIIALVTLALPLYITAHYSSSRVMDSVPAPLATSPPSRPLLKVSEGAR